MSEALDIGDDFFGGDPAHNRGQRVNQATFGEDGSLGWDRIKKIRAEAWEKYEAMAPSDLWATFQMLQKRHDELQRFAEFQQERVNDAETEVIKSRRRGTLVSKLWEFNTVRQKLRVAHQRIAAQSAGYADNDDDGPRNTLTEIAQHILDVLTADDQAPENPTELLNLVDQSRGTEKRSTYRYLHDKMNGKPESVEGWKEWAEDQTQ